MSRRSVRADDLLAFRVPDDVQVSPAGSVVVWTERWADADKNRTLSRLMMARVGEVPRPLTTGGVDSQPRISPDGSRVAFLRRDADTGDVPAKIRLCVIRLDGGEAVDVVEVAGELGAPAWAPDGTQVCLSYRRADPVLEGQKRPLSIRATRLPYKMDGRGYLPPDCFHLYLVRLSAAEPTLAPLTDLDGPWDETCPTWSPDGRCVAFLSNRRSRPGALDLEASDLFTVSVYGGDRVQCTAARGATFSPTWSPDGTWIAAYRCVGPPGTALFKDNVTLHRISTDGSGDEECLVPGLDRCTMQLTIDDVWGMSDWAPRPAFAAGGGQLLFPVADHGTTCLASLALNTRGRPVGGSMAVVNDRVLMCFSVATDADVVVLITSADDTPGRVERCRLDGSERGLIAWPMEPWCNEVDLIAPLELSVTAPGQAPVQGWLLLPPGEGPHPLLISIHGGPVVQYGKSFFHELQLLAAHGYGVLYVNPRGSQGYGAAFAAANHRDWGEGPLADVLAALDDVLESHPIDPARVGVFGGSYGGYLTSWAISHSDRFAAACTQRTVSDLRTLFWGDFGPTLAETLGAQPWDDPDLYARLSPITYAERIHTPLLIMQGLEDHRTPPDQGEMLFVKLQTLGRCCELVLFPGAGHGLSRGGPPLQRIRRLELLVEWFDRWLMAEAADTTA